MRGTSAEAEQRPAQSERLSQLSESLPEWRIRRSGGGAERFVVPFVTIAAEPEDMARRGWSSFADTRHFIFSKTISEDQRFRHFLAAVCRRRWPSGRRLQAPQRPTDFGKAICRAIQTDRGRKSFSGGVACGAKRSQAASAARKLANVPFSHGIRAWAYRLKLSRCSVVFSKFNSSRARISREIRLLSSMRKAAHF